MEKEIESKRAQLRASQERLYSIENEIRQNEGHLYGHQRHQKELQVKIGTVLIFRNWSVFHNYFDFYFFFRWMIVFSVYPYFCCLLTLLFAFMLFTFVHCLEQNDRSYINLSMCFFYCMVYFLVLNLTNFSCFFDTNRKLLRYLMQLPFPFFPLLFLLNLTSSFLESCFSSCFSFIFLIHFNMLNMSPLSFNFFIKHITTISHISLFSSISR